jgi:hypothetical protein
VTNGLVTLRSKECAILTLVIVSGWYIVDF